MVLFPSAFSRESGAPRERPAPTPVSPQAWGTKVPAAACAADGFQVVFPMQKIEVLSPHVADLIAAGEVVERPASVVKELVENAVDAGAHTVTVEIQRGGMAMIRVTDDGGGIPADQCATAFLRHATSKLRTAQDLEAIGTLGFRGEALAAIAAVARVELFTRTPQEDLGTTLTIEGGEILSQEPAGCPLGTTFVVRDLFYNTPARLKFMKRDAAEGAAVFSLVQKLALSHPQVSLRFVRDGRQELMTPGDGQLKSALYGVLGRDMALGYTPVQGEGEDVTVTGFVTLPACCRGSRTYQHFFVNGRPVKSKLLMAALERAYENQKMVGKFPGCVLQVQVKPNAVDVNVHPAKTEVKFLSERKVFDGVYYAVLSALQGQMAHPAMTLEAKPQPQPQPAPASRPTLREPASAALLRPVPKPAYTVSSHFPTELSPGSAGLSTASGENVDKPVENVEKPHKTPPTPPRTRFPAPAPDAGGEQQRLSIPRATPEEAPAPAEDGPAPAGPAPVPVPESSGGAGEPAPAAPPVPVQEETLPWRLVGEVFQTYLLVEQGEVVHLIDKHAAHERMQFDRMKAADYQPMAQTLLVPVVFTPAPEEGEVLIANLPLLARFGFLCEEFGGGALVVRAVPDYLDPGQAEGALTELAGQLLAGSGADPQAARDTLLHTMACKAAVKGGQRNSREELLVVARAVLAGDVKYCPHGRPVAITLTKGELEKQFKRS